MQPNVTENTVQATNPQEQLEEKIVQPAVQVQENKEEIEDINWKKFREARKKEREEKEAAERRLQDKEKEAEALKAAMEAILAKQPPPPAYGNEFGYQEEETEDQRIQKKVDAALAARENQYRTEAAEREAREYPQKLKQTYPDYDTVVNQETLEYLEYHYPEVARPLERLPNGYDKWSDIYRAVRKFVPNIENARKDANRAEANFNKPKSMSSTPQTPIPTGAGSAILSKEKRASNWERMQKALRGVSS